MAEKTKSTEVVELTDADRVYDNYQHFIVTKDDENDEDLMSDKQFNELLTGE